MKKILVIGDTCFDDYMYYTSDRQSPEDPKVPVLKNLRRELYFGMALNVCHAIKHLGGRCVESWRNYESDAEETRKERIFCNGVQICRLDFDYKALPVLMKGDYEKLSEYAVISDYAKGAIPDPQRWIIELNSIGKKVIVDPKGDDWTKYRGAWAIKATNAEFEAAAKGNIRSLLQLVKHIIVTDADKPVAVFSSDGSIFMVAPPLTSAVDVSGAGDVFIGALALHLEMGLSLKAAVQIATNEASRSCTFKGTGFQGFNGARDELLAKYGKKGNPDDK